MIIASILQQTIIDILVKMASSLAPIAETWPENELPQWQQKIALRAENPSGRCVTVRCPLYFLQKNASQSSFEGHSLEILLITVPYQVCRRRGQRCSGPWPGCRWLWHGCPRRWRRTSRCSGRQRSPMPGWPRCRKRGRRR